jgi:tetratricopeptide (TPR) repeat protein
MLSARLVAKWRDLALRLPVVWVPGVTCHAWGALSWPAMTCRCRTHSIGDWTGRVATRDWRYQALTQMVDTDDQPDGWNTMPGVKGSHDGSDQSAAQDVREWMRVKDASEHAEQVLRDVLHARRIVGDQIDNDDDLVASGRSPFRSAEDVARWWDAQHDHILSVIESLIADGQPETAASLLSQVWTIVPARAQPRWRGRLRECGTRLATELPTSRVVADVLRYSAQACIQQVDYQDAELDGMRELVIWRRLDDYPGAVDALRRLADTFRLRDRLHRVIDCADQILTWSSRYQDQTGVAGALRNLGLVMVEVGRVDAAIDYLSRARDTLDVLPDVPVVRRAELIAQLGRALWMSGAESLARRRFSEALALLVDVDDAAADQIRTLLGTSAGTALPASVMEGMDHV